MVAEPTAKDFPDISFTWTNRLAKAVVTISRTAFEFDQTRQTSSLLHSLGARLANWPDKLFFTRLRNGTDATLGVCYTTKAYFATDHSIGDSGEFSNLQKGTTTTEFLNANSVVTVAQQLQRDFTLALATLYGYKDDRGEPFHMNSIDPDNLVILCSPKMEYFMRMAFMKKRISASDNPLVGSVRKIVTSNYLPVAGDEATDWYLAHLGERNRPFVYSRFRPIKDSEVEDLQNELTGSGMFGGQELDTGVVKEIASVMLETNMGHQGMKADLDVMLNERFTIVARWRGEIFPLEPRNMIKISSAA